MPKVVVTFTGLFLLARDQDLDTSGNPAGDIRSVVALAVDARAGRGHAPGHAAGTKAPEPHVGFVRVPAGNLRDTPGLAGTSDLDEVVMRLDRTEIALQGPNLTGPIKSENDNHLDQIPKVADFSRHAVLKDLGLGLDPKCLESPPRDGVLGRFRFAGGKIGVPDARYASYIKAPDPGGAPSGGTSTDRGTEIELSNQIEWTCDVPDGTQVSLELKRFDDGTSRGLALQPDERGNIRIDLFNTCATNPLEWPELGPRGGAEVDVDFQWFYSLMTGKLPDRLPVPVRPGGAGAADPWTCMLATIAIVAVSLPWFGTGGV